MTTESRLGDEVVGVNFIPVQHCIPDWRFDGMQMDRHAVYSVRQDLIELRDEAIKQGDLPWGFKLSIAIMTLAHFAEMMARITTPLVCPDCGNREEVDWDPPFTYPPCSAECGSDKPMVYDDRFPHERTKACQLVFKFAESPFKRLLEKMRETNIEVQEGAVKEQLNDLLRRSDS